MKEKELEKLKKDAQHLQNKQNAIDNLLRLNIQRRYYNLTRKLYE
jgi:hypothetical protein